MILIEEIKTIQLISRKIGEKISFIPVKEFLNSLNYIKKDTIWWLFEIKDLVAKISGDTYIWTKDKCVEFPKAKQTRSKKKDISETD